MKSVYAVVLNYDNIEDTIECLKSIKNQNYPNLRILLVDNASKESVVSAIREKFPDIEILRLEENVGYGGGNNAGIRRVVDLADYIFVVNNDVVLEENTISEMVKEMEKDTSIAASQPVVRYYGSKIIWSAGTEMFFGYPRLYMKGELREITESFEPPFGLVGCAMMFRSDALRDVGLFDESLFMMHEETEWCIRAKKKGYRFLVCKCNAYHKVSRTLGLFSNRYLYYTARNWLIVARKAGIALFLKAILTEPLRIGYYFTTLREKKKILYYLRGLLDGLGNVKGRKL